MSPSSNPRRAIAVASQTEGIWSSVKGDTLSSQIAQQIRQALFANQLKAGDSLGSEKALTKRFGVSRMAVRDALRSLESAGILEIRVGAKGGVFIAQANHLKFADALAIQLQLVGMTIEEMFDAQIAIEVTATEFAAKRATPADIEKLQSLLATLRDLAQPNLTPKDALRFTELSMQFHETLVETAHNRALAMQFKALRIVLEPIYARRTSAAIARRVVVSHKALLDSIVAGDAERATALMRKRLDTIRAHQLIAAVEK